MSNQNYYGIQKSDYQSSLSHFKYIKRVKKNGKWRYYYDKKSLKRDIKDKLGFDERDAYRRAKRETLAEKEKYDKAMDYVDTQNKGVISGTIDDQGRLTADKYTINLLKAGKKYADSMVNYDSAKNKYYKTPIGTIPGFMEKVTKGASYISSKLEEIDKN